MSEYSGRAALVVVLLTVISITLGIATGILWAFGYLPFVRLTMPQFVLIGIVIVLLTSIIIAWLASILSRMKDESACGLRTAQIYAKAAVLTELLTIICALTVLLTMPSFIVKLIIAIFGSIVFWAMILFLLATLYSVIRIRFINR